LSNSYLTKFRSSLPKTQGDQILRLLTKKRDSGEIRTVAEFKERLQELTTKLLSEHLQPTLQLYKAVGGEDIFSEEYNDMLERVNDDLEAAFAETDNIEEILAAHNNIILNAALKSLRFGVNKLEAQIALYEFIHQSGYGFDDALYNTFKKTEESTTPRQAQAAGLLYVDPRTGSEITSSYDAFIDEVGERLIMSADQVRYIPVQSANWLSNSNSIRSELDVSFPHSNINNILDNTRNTFWVVPILQSYVRKEGARAEIELVMGTSQDVNFVEIEPAVKFPLRLLGVDYVDGSNTRLSTNISELFIDGPVRLNFERVTCRSLIIRVAQDNFTETQFQQKGVDSLFQRAVAGEKDLKIDTLSVSNALENILSSDFVLTELFAAQAQGTKICKYYEYIIGFDNLRAGYSVYADKAIYVSPKKALDKPGIISLKTLETRPVKTGDETVFIPRTFSYPVRSNDEDLKLYHSSIEYFLAIQSYSTTGLLVSTDLVPMLPLGAERIYHERLVFTHRTSTGYFYNNAGRLMFYADSSDSSDFIVYKNGVVTSSWEFVDPSSSTGLTNNTPNNGTPMSLGISLLDEPSPMDIYTVSYSPMVSNTPIVPNDTTILYNIDLTGDLGLRTITDNVIAVEPKRRGFDIDRADCYLVVIMRRNAADPNASPSLEEFMLTTGSRNTGKFDTIQ